MKKIKISSLVSLIVLIFTTTNIKATTTYQNHSKKLNLISIEFYYLSFFIDVPFGGGYFEDDLINYVIKTRNSPNRVCDTIYDEDLLISANNYLIKNPLIRKELNLDNVDSWNVIFGNIELAPKKMKRIYDIRFVSVLNYGGKRIQISFPRPYKKEKINYMIVNGVCYQRDVSLFTTLYMLMINRNDS